MADSTDPPIDALTRSVQTAPRSEVPLGASWLISLLQQSDGIIPWGHNPKGRDRQLREFLPTETGLVSAQAIVCARNAALSWKLTGEDKTIEAAQQMMNNANFGGGWEQFVIQVSQDLYTQDSGAFVEAMRQQERPDSPVVGFAHLDSARCYQTGNPEFPVVFEDITGKFHRLPWFNVIHLLEMPAPIVPNFGGPFYRLQYSAVTRALRNAQVLRSIAQYKDEKVSGRFLRAVHLVSGVSDTVIQDALRKAQAGADGQGLTRYIQPAIVGGVDPNTPIKNETIELSSLPEGWNEEESMRVYILLLAMAYLTDYQEFAPLPGGNLGTSTQSEVLHMKSKGKGPGLFQKMITRMMNGVLLPANVEFEYDEPDLNYRAIEDENAKLRAEARQIRILSGEIDVPAAQQIAFEEGDLPEAVFDDLRARAAQQAAADAAVTASPPPPAPNDTAQGVVEGEGLQPTADGQIAGDSQQGMRSIVAVDDPEADAEEYALFKATDAGVPFGHLLSSRLHRAYSDVSDDTHAMGYFQDTDQRKVVGQSIGPALKVLEDALKEADIFDLMVSPEDADRIAFASIELLEDERTGERAVNTPPDPLDGDRLTYEREVGERIAVGLGRVRRIIRDRLMATQTA